MITSIGSIVALVVIFIVEHLLSFIVKKSRVLLHIYSTVWLIIYLGLFATAFQIDAAPVVKGFVFLVTAGLGVRSAVVYHTPRYATEMNKSRAKQSKED